MLSYPRHVGLKGHLPSHHRAVMSWDQLGVSWMRRRFPTPWNWITFIFDSVRITVDPVG